jgi:hypothetical protein
MASKHLITLAQAAKMTKNYRALKENILDSSFRRKDILPESETFNRDAFEAILAQKGCTAVRIYMAADDLGQVKLMAVGVNAEEQDILTESDPVIIEEGIRCPTQCPPPSTLNS